MSRKRAHDSSYDDDDDDDAASDASLERVAPPVPKKRRKGPRNLDADVLQQWVELGGADDPKAGQCIYATYNMRTKTWETAPRVLGISFVVANVDEQLLLMSDGMEIVERITHKRMPTFAHHTSSRRVKDIRIYGRHELCGESLTRFASTSRSFISGFHHVARIVREIRRFAQRPNRDADALSRLLLDAELDELEEPLRILGVIDLRLFKNLTHAYALARFLGTLDPETRDHLLETARQC